MRRYGNARLSAVIALLTGYLFCSATVARADIISWDGGGDGTSFGDPLNWSTDTVPDYLDTAMIMPPYTPNIVFSDWHYSQYLSVLSGPTSIDLNGYSYDVEGESGSGNPAIVVAADLNLLNGDIYNWMGSGVLIAPGDGAGSLTLTGASSYVYMEFNGIVITEGSGTGSLTLEGLSSGAYLDCYDDIVICQGDGTGSLTITASSASASVYCYNDIVLGQGSGAGSLTLAGSSASAYLECNDLVIGSVGTGVLDMLGGARVDSYGTMTIAELAGSVGTATLDGTTTNDLDCGWGTLIVGMGGNGSLVGLDPCNISAGTCIVGGEKGSIGNMTINDTGSSSNSVSINDWILGYWPGSFGEVTMSGNLTHSNGSWLTVANEGNGVFTLEDGASADCSSATIADNMGSDGSMLVRGIGTELNVEWDIHVADGGHGVLTIESGASVDCGYMDIAGESGSDGTVTVSGVNTWLDADDDISVGESGMGTLNISDGAGVGSREAFIGADMGSLGTASINGPGSMWINFEEFFIVGVFGSASLEINQGGQMWNPTASLGLFAGSTASVTVDGVGSLWNNYYELRIGQQGSGTLTITNGGAVLNTLGILGELPGSDGTVNIDGAGSTWTNFSDLRIGGVGSGTLSITNGGTAFSEGGLVGDYPGSNGTVTIDGPGSSWFLLNSLSIGAYGTGSLTVSNGGAVVSPAIIVKDNGSAGGNGLLDGNVVNYGGIVSPGLSIGTLTIDGVYQQYAPGILDIELGSGGPDVLIITGNAMLGGTLQLSFEGGYDPKPGTEFIIMTAGSIIGTFDEVVGPVVFDVIYGQTTVTVIVMNATPLCPWDLDNSGSVGTGDLLALFAQWGTAGPADFDGNGVVNTADLLILFANWGPCS